MNQIYITFIFTIISLINFKLLSFFGVDLKINGNFEFTKSMSFIFLNSIFFIVFLIINFRKKIIINKSIFLFIILFLISIITSDYTYTNILGNNIKGHGLMLFINIIFLYIIIINTTKNDLKRSFKWINIFSIFSIFYALKEYFYPSFDYGELSNRALGSFGHPNYLAFYLLFLITYNLNNLKTKINISILILSIFTLFLTKSIIAIFVFIIYMIYFLSNKNKFRLKKIYLFFLFFSLSIIIVYIVYNFGFITKLNSFISRFYIWETSFFIYTDNIKNIIFGMGNDSLSYIFERLKSPYLYIYENIGYTADRPHNFIINILLSFGLLGLGLFIFLITKFIKNYKNNYYNHFIILFFVFYLFNFPTIISYIILVLSLGFFKKYKKKYNHFLIKIIFIILSSLSILFSFLYIKEEVKIKNLEKNKSNNIFLDLKNENPEYKIFNNIDSIDNICIDLINNSNSVENYFYCGDLYKKIDKEKSVSYYEKGLEKLPDMRNKNSIYYKNIIVKNIFSKQRFFSEKFSDIKNILENLNIEID